MTNEGQVQFTFERNTSITVANSTEMILTTRDTGQGNVTFCQEAASLYVHKFTYLQEMEAKMRQVTLLNT